MKKFVNLLFVCPLPQIGGGELMLLNQLKRIDRNIFNFLVVCSHKGPLLERLREVSIPVKTLKIIRLRSPFDAFMAFWRLKKIIKDKDIDVVNSFGVNVITSLSVKILKVPFILYIHTIHPLRFWERICVRIAERLIAVSEASKKVLVKYGVNPRKIQVIYNGLDIEEFMAKKKGIDIRKEFSIDNNTPLVGFIGRLAEQKGIHYLIKAVPYIVKTIPEVKFLIVGETPREDSLNIDFKHKMIRLSSQLGIKDNIVFTGFREDIPDILEKIDVFVLPSLLEACPLTVLEAMAIGKAMVVTDVGGIPELVNKDIASIVKPADEKNLAKAVIDLLKDKEKRMRMGQGCRKRLVEKFDLKLNIKRLQEAQLNILNRASQKSFSP